MNTDNASRQIQLEKITLNIGTGTGGEQLQRGMKLLEKLTKQTPLRRASKLRIPTWGVRPGLEVGCKVTVRGATANALLLRLLKAVDLQIPKKSFDPWGNFSFGIHEYLLIPGAEYDPEIGIVGLQVVVTLMRPGYRIARRRLLQRSVPRRQRITAEEATAYAQKQWGVIVV